MSDIERIYKYLRWRMYQSDDVAIQRVENISNTFKKLFKEHKAYSSLRNKKEIKILELTCGSGIAGAAISKVLHDMGYNIHICFTDVRKEDLKYVDEWLEMLDLEDIDYTTIKVDAIEIDEHLDDNYDLIISWGSSIAHFDVFEYISMLSSIHELAKQDAVVMIEQANIGWRIMFNRSFERLVVEGGLTEDGKGVISIFAGYDPIKGVQLRQYYIVPEYKYIGMMKSRLWDISSLLGFLWIYFKNIDAIQHFEIRNTYILLAWDKRKIPGVELKYIDE